MYPEIKKFWLANDKNKIYTYSMTLNRNLWTIHPDILAFWEYKNNIISCERFAYCDVYNGTFNIANPLAIIYKNKIVKSKYWIDDFGEAYSEDQMLKLIKLKAFI